MFHLDIFRRKYLFLKEQYWNVIFFYVAQDIPVRQN